MRDRPLRVGSWGSRRLSVVHISGTLSISAKQSSDGRHPTSGSPRNRSFGLAAPSPALTMAPVGRTQQTTVTGPLLIAAIRPNRGWLSVAGSPKGPPLALPTLPPKPRIWPPDRDQQRTGNGPLLIAVRWRNPELR